MESKVDEQSRGFFWPTPKIERPRSSGWIWTYLAPCVTALPQGESFELSNLSLSSVVELLTPVEGGPLCRPHSRATTQSVCSCSTYFWKRFRSMMVDKGMTLLPTFKGMMCDLGLSETSLALASDHRQRRV